MTTRRPDWIALVALALVAALAGAQTAGVPKRAPRPEEYGGVVMERLAAKGAGAVSFSHWLHRARYTCRLCHVDLGFAMVANQTGVTQADIDGGVYCGACHDGKVAFASEEKGPGGATRKHCDRCHSVGKNVVPAHDFRELAAQLPKARFGNRIDWLAAEQQGKIHLQDYLEGVSIRRQPLPQGADFKISPEVGAIPKIIFSHEKHSVWNGCELCHPQIFGVKKGQSGVRMQEIFAGKYCGVCHGKVAFPNLDCQLCHTEPVAMSGS